MDGEQRLRRGPGTHYYMFAPPGRNVGTTVGAPESTAGRRRHGAIHLRRGSGCRGPRRPQPTRHRPPRRRYLRQGAPSVPHRVDIPIIFRRFFRNSAAVAVWRR
jgi:hypothetical protein